MMQEQTLAPKPLTTLIICGFISLKTLRSGMALLDNRPTRWDALDWRSYTAAIGVNHRFSSSAHRNRRGQNPRNFGRISVCKSLAKRRF
jgi:hypothetical protein